jgi:GNAT superfamily N-acetyltransferase
MGYRHPVTATMHKMGEIEAILVPSPNIAECWNAAASILKVSFPAEELGSTFSMFAELSGPNRDLWIDRYDNTRAVAVTSALGTPAADVLLELLAVEPTVRSSGLGARFLRSLIAQCRAPIILEVEDPEVLVTSDASRRIAFYERLGGVVIPDSVGYAMPNLQSRHGTLPMRLIEMDEERAKELRGPALRDLVTAIWTAAYARPQDDRDLASVLAQMRCES